MQDWFRGRLGWNIDNWGKYCAFLHYLPCKFTFESCRYLQTSASHFGFSWFETIFSWVLWTKHIFHKLKDKWLTLFICKGLVPITFCNRAIDTISMNDVSYSLFSTILMRNSKQAKWVERAATVQSEQFYWSSYN